MNKELNVYSSANGRRAKPHWRLHEREEENGKYHEKHLDNPASALAEAVKRSGTRRIQEELFCVTASLNGDVVVREFFLVGQFSDRFSQFAFSSFGKEASCLLQHPHQGWAAAVWRGLWCVIYLMQVGTCFVFRPVLAT